MVSGDKNQPGSNWVFDYFNELLKLFSVNVDKEYPECHAENIMLNLLHSQPHWYSTYSTLCYVDLFYINNFINAMSSACVLLAVANIF